MGKMTLSFKLTGSFMLLALIVPVSGFIGWRSSGKAPRWQGPEKRFITGKRQGHVGPAFYLYHYLRLPVQAVPV